MDAETTYTQLKTIALLEFPDVVVSASVLRGPLRVAESLRLFLVDTSFLEVWISGDKYSYHWQRRDGTIYRHDNAPHKKHRHVKTFPKHFHDCSEDKVKESIIADDPNNAVRDFLSFVRDKIR